MGLWLSPVGWDMYALCIWPLLLRQHRGMKPKAVIMWVFLRSPLTIFCLFSNCMPPTQGSNYSFGCPPLASNLYSPIGGIYIVALCYISSRQPSENSFNAMQREGCGLRGGSPLIDEGDITCHLFPVAGRQHVCHPNETTVLSHLPGSDNEARSLSQPGSAIYWQIHATPKNLDYLRFTWKLIVLSAFQCFYIQFDIVYMSSIIPSFFNYFLLATLRE